MIESIHIKNLGPIKDIKIDEIKPLTVFIGESGSGKSTLMKVLSIFRWIYKMQNIRSYLKHSRISKSPFRFRMDTYLKISGLDEFINDNTLIIYKTEMPSGKSYELRFEKRKLVLGNSIKELIERNDLYFVKVSFISETRNIIPLWADKGARLAGGFLGFYFHEVYNDFDIATNAIKEISLPYLNIKFTTRKSKNGGKEYSIKAANDEYQIYFKNSSSGTQTSVPISIISKYFSQHFAFEDAFNRSVLNYLSNTDKLTDFQPVKNLSEIGKMIYIHIEEPELSLYPDAQRSLINDVVANCFNKNIHTVGLIFSTHSPYIINHLNLLIKAYDKDKLVERAKIDFDQIAVFEVANGKINDLKALNNRIINTNALSDTMNAIYDDYNKLG